MARTPLATLDQVTTGSAGAVAAHAATLVQAPAATGVDDTAALNALLAANPGKVIKGRPGSSYRTSVPLVLPTGTRLDMTGCTVTLLAGSNCNMVVNGAVNTVRRVLDAVMTSASATLTSATAAFTNADVGKAVTVQGAGAAGVPLTTTISAYIGATSVTLAATAGATVSGQYAAIGAREANVGVVGGHWDRGANGPGGSLLGHTFRFRHVDGLTVTGATFAATAGKYAVNPGDCTGVRIRDLSFPDYSSDGVHLNGPCRDVHVVGLSGGAMGDDIMSLTARDSTSLITDCAGDLTDITVDTVYYQRSTILSSVLKVVAGKTTDGSADYTVRNLKARNLTGPNDTAAVVYMGDSSGGQFKDITLDGITSLGSAAGGNQVVSMHGGTFDKVRVLNMTPHATDGFGVACDATAVGRLIVGQSQWDSTRAGASLVYVGGPVDRLLVNGVQADTSGGSTALVRLAVAAAAVDRITLTNVDWEATGSGNNPVIVASASAALAKVNLSNLSLVGIAYPLGRYMGATKVAAANVDATGMTSWVYGNGAAADVTITGASGLSGDVDTIAADSPGRVVTTDLNGTVLSSDPDRVTVGDETMHRLFAWGTPQLSTGHLTLTYFTARRTETVNTVRTFTLGNASSGAVLCRIGIYSVNAGGDLTLVASTADDPTLWATGFSGNTRTLQAPWGKVAGRRYAMGVLFVGTTGPRLVGVAPLSGSEAAVAPRINGSVASQTDLPSSVAAGTVTASQGISVYGRLSPS